MRKRVQRCRRHPDKQGRALYGLLAGMVLLSLTGCGALSPQGSRVFCTQHRFETQSQTSLAAAYRSGQTESVSEPVSNYGRPVACAS